MNFTYEKCVCPDNSREIFKQAAKRIDEVFPNAQKSKLLLDVDGTAILSWHVNGEIIRLLDDYEVGSVYILSQIPIPDSII